MKKSLNICGGIKVACAVAYVCTLGTASVAHASAAGVEVDIPARFMFIPGGFDSNDQVQVTLDGYLPNACYKLAQPRIAFDSTTHTYTVTTVANSFEADNVACGTYVVPYTVSATLGQVPAGDYIIETLGAQKMALHVKESSGVGPDDFLYAPVDHIHVRVDLTQKSIVTSIEGRFTNSCMRWKEIKIIDEGSTVIVIPIIRLEERADCVSREMTYKTMEAMIPWRQPGRYMVHVRGLSGAATNHVFDVDAVR